MTVAIAMTAAGAVLAVMVVINAAGFAGTLAATMRVPDRIAVGSKEEPR